VPKDRHKGILIRVWLHTYPSHEFSRFERLTPNCKTRKEAILKLMEDAEKSMDLEQKLKKANSQIEDLKQQPKEIIKEVPKIEYRDRIVEVPKSIGIEKERLQKSLGSLENNLKKLPAVIWGLKEVVLYFQVTQQARAERQAKAEIQPSTNKEGDKPTQTPVMERTTKRTTTEEVNEKIPMQETEDQQIICPLGKGVVSVKKECMHECQDFAQCSTYMALLKNYTRNPSNP
jgi:hypothetical protein